MCLCFASLPLRSSMNSVKSAARSVHGSGVALSRSGAFNGGGFSDPRFLAGGKRGYILAATEGGSGAVPKYEKRTTEFPTATRGPKTDVRKTLSPSERIVEEEILQLRAKLSWHLSSIYTAPGPQCIDVSCVSCECFFFVLDGILQANSKAAGRFWRPPFLNWAYHGAKRQALPNWACPMSRATHGAGKHVALSLLS